MTDSAAPHDRYAEAYLADYGFERVMVAQRRRFLLELIDAGRPDIVLEVGCGLEPLFAAAPGPGRWVTVEPARVFAERARELAADDARVAVIEAAVEALDWPAAAPRPPDLVLLSSVLHEVDDPAGMLRAVHRLCGPRTLVHANVPNADSMHRRLAVAMGLIADTQQPSARNLQLRQKQVFTAAEFRALFERCGFRVEEEGGYFIKPFTHAQMDAISATIGEDVLNGLYSLGRSLPALASELYLGAYRQ